MNIDSEYSNIEFESKQDLEKWIRILFEKNENVLPDIPYSFFEIQRELIRKENLDLN